MNQHNVLITGATGFIGSALYEIIKTENKVVGLSRSKTADLQMDLSINQPVLPDVDLVIHTAGLAHTMVDDQVAMHQNNVAATDNLLNSLNPFCLKGFIFCSSVSVYGKTYGVDIDESVVPFPSDSYGESKYKAEQLVTNWCSRHAVPYLILRLPLIVDVNAPGNIGRMKDSLRKGRFFLVKGNQSKRSMVHLNDLVGLIQRQVKYGINKSGVYNLSDGNGIDFNDFVLAVCSSEGFRKPIMLPFWIAKILAIAGSILGGKLFSLSVLGKMTKTLTFSSIKAKNDLQWSPRSVLNTMQVIR